MKHYCATCAAFREDDVCPVCLEPTRPASTAPVSVATETERAPDGAGFTPPPPPDAPDRTPDPEPVGSTPVESAVAEPAEPEPRDEVLATDDDASPVEPAVSASTVVSPGVGGAPIIPKTRQSELEQYIADGYEVFLIAGIAGTGKTQLLSAYQEDAFLAEVRKVDGHALPTAPRRLDCLTVSVGRRKVVFVDAAGENFRQLHPLQRLDGEVPEAAVDFLRLVSSRLRGVVLLLSLDDLWDRHDDGPTGQGQRQQVEILIWILMLLRWLQDDGAYPQGPISFQQHVNRQVKRARRRLKVPVLTLFSRADELHGLPVPPPGVAWLGHDAPSRTLRPVGEDPLLLAHHRLPKLMTGLRTHVDHFRLDFVHSLYLDPDTGAIVNDGGCGLSSSLAWLLDDAWRSRLPGIPTRVWLDLQRLVDETLLRRDRWRVLPDARPLT